MSHATGKWQWRSFCLAACLGTLLPSLARSETDARMWIDDTGRHRVQATLIDAADGRIKLRKLDGVEILLPFDGLSEKDRRFVGDAMWAREHLPHYAELQALQAHPTLQPLAAEELLSKLFSETPELRMYRTEEEFAQLTAPLRERQANLKKQWSDLDRQLSRSSVPSEVSRAAKSQFALKAQQRWDFLRIVLADREDLAELPVFTNQRPQLASRFPATRRRAFTQLEAEAGNSPQGNLVAAQLPADRLAALEAISRELVPSPVWNRRNEAFERLAMTGQLNRNQTVMDRLAEQQRDANQQVKEFLTTKATWWRDEGLPVLEQIFQPENDELRAEFVRLTSQIATAEAAKVLARRAVFDPSPEIRAAAIESLRGRRPADYRSVFVENLNFPWLPAAQHAAEALMALEDRGAVRELERVLYEADFHATYREEKGSLQVRELVKINHLANCLLCHPPAATRLDPILTITPTSQSFPQFYYSSGSPGATDRFARTFSESDILNHESGSGFAVRVDSTYLRQDFSTTHFVASNDKPNSWPSLQRFDYLARWRNVTEEERAAAEAALRNGSDPNSLPAPSPHRQATLTALHYLRNLPARARP